MLTGRTNQFRVALLVLMLSIAPLCAVASQAQFEEHEVVAVFLYRFAHFINWPASSFERPSSPLRYCLMKNNPVADALAEVIEGETSGGHPLEIAPVSGPEDLVGCHVVFLSGDDRIKLQAIGEKLKIQSSLTVTDTEKLLSNGAMIALGSTGPRVQPIINVAAIAAAGLKVNAKLMSIATEWDG